MYIVSGIHLANSLRASNSQSSAIYCNIPFKNLRSNKILLSETLYRDCHRRKNIKSDLDSDEVR